MWTAVEQQARVGRRALVAVFQEEVLSEGEEFRFGPNARSSSGLLDAVQEGGEVVGDDCLVQRYGYDVVQSLLGVSCVVVH